MDLVRPFPLTPIDEKTKNSIARRLSERGASHPKCEMCANDSWIIGDYIVSPTVVTKDTPASTTVPVDTKHFPSILLMCNNCGNSKMMNSMVLNVFDLLQAEMPSKDTAA